MANGRNKSGKGESGRDAGGFVALPWSVLDCAAYARLSHPARALMLEIARQFVKDNNGKLLASGTYLRKRGWNSADVITRAKRELIAAGFIFETVMGQRPNRASWYAVTWQRLDRLKGYDEGALESFRRGEYASGEPLPQPVTREVLYEKWRHPANQNKSLTPSGGVEDACIAPSGGVGGLPVAPGHGAIDPVLVPLPTPSNGNHLDMPSIAVDCVCTAPDQQDEVVRVRDCDQDPSQFHDGEYFQKPHPPAQMKKRAADRWVATALATKSDSTQGA